jgi:hypothetical protein
MINQEYQDRVQGLGNEIAFNLADTVAVQKLILLQDLEKEVEAYYMDQEEISYGELEYETIQTLRIEGYRIVDKTEYTITIGKKIAEEIHNTSKTHKILIKDIEDELDYHDYPSDIDKEDIIHETINALINLDYLIIESEELITPFPYHCTPNVIVKPFDEDKFENIKGLELEISDEDYIVEQLLAELAGDNIIATPNNWDNPNIELPNIALEEDGSVKYELIFKAQTNEKLLAELEKIKTLEEIVQNTTGTSAHIHINRAYIEDELGLTETDIIKAAEFLSHPLFLISGRTKETALEWARSTLPCPIEANLAEKAKYVDRLNKISYAKYSFLNCGKEDTIELRIFSNKCNFNKYVINMYLETVDFIIELAKYMENRSYTKELQNIIPLIRNHFEKFGETLNFFDTKELIMDEFKEPKTLLKTAIKNEWITIDNEISRVMHYARTTLRTYETIRKFISMIKTLNKEYECNYDFNINPETTDIQKLAGEIRRDIRKTYEIKMEAI